MGEVRFLPVVRVERVIADPRAALVEIFSGRVSEAEIEIFLGELHRRGLGIVSVVETSGE
jgi:hypothetical protein